MNFRTSISTERCLIMLHINITMWKFISKFNSSTKLKHNEMLYLKFDTCQVWLKQFN